LPAGFFNARIQAEIFCSILKKENSVQPNIKEVVYIELKDLTPAQLGALHEFLRVEMIVPLMRQEGYLEQNGHPDRRAIFSGCFDHVSAEKVMGWIRKIEPAEEMLSLTLLGVGP
jgi:hypothetical protein